MKKILEKHVSKDDPGEYYADIELYDCVGPGDYIKNIKYQNILKKGEDTHFMKTIDKTGKYGDSVTATTPLKNGKYLIEVYKLKKDENNS